MRDPWFPLVVILAVLICSWLGIFGPLDAGLKAWSDWLHKWQTLASALVAVGAAAVAYWNTNRLIRNSNAAESRGRRQKLAAARARLPLALTEVCAFARASMSTLCNLASHSQQLDTTTYVPAERATELAKAKLSGQVLEPMMQVIEFAGDDLDPTLFTQLAAWAQIHEARTGGLRDENSNGPIARDRIIALMLDTASLHAGAAIGLEYARRREECLPRQLRWKDVSDSVGAMNVSRFDFPELWILIDERRKHSVGPFDSLSAHD